MAGSQSSSGPSLLNWWFQPITPWIKTFENFIHPETNTAQTQNVFVGSNKQDEAVENNVLKEAGSYGRHISKMSKALDVLVTNPPPNLSTEQRLAIKDYLDFRTLVNAAIRGSRGPKSTELTLGYFDRLGDALKERKRSNKDPEDFARIARMLSIVAERYKKEGDLAFTESNGHKSTVKRKRPARV